MRNLNHTAGTDQVLNDCTGLPKNRHTFFVRLNFICRNFIIYWPILKLISLSELGEHFK